MTAIKLSEHAELRISPDAFFFIKSPDGEAVLKRDEAYALWQALYDKFSHPTRIPVTEEEVKACMENPVVLSPEDEVALAKAQKRLFKKLGIKP